MHANLTADCRNDQAVVVQQAAVVYFIPCLRRQRALPMAERGTWGGGGGRHQEQDMRVLT